MNAPWVIAHVLSSFNLGGQERVALDLARLQRNEGHTVLAVSLGSLPEGPAGRAFRDAGVAATTIGKRHRFDPLLPFRLAAHLRREHVSIVHTHNPHALIYGAPAGRLASAVVIHSKHGMNVDLARRLWLRRVAARLVDAYVAVAPVLGAVALEDGDCARTNLFVIPNGVDVARFRPNQAARDRMRSALGIAPDAWVVGTVGRLAPEKDQGLLVDAMAPLLSERRHLVIVGEGSERGLLEAKIASTPGGQYAHLVGAREDVEELMAGFDAFALTSRTEGLPLVLLEAMATVIPVVSTAVGGIPELVEHTVNGLLTPVGNVKELTRHLSLLSADRELSRRIGEAGRRYVIGRHSVERMASEYGALYAQALEPRDTVAHAQA